MKSGQVGHVINIAPLQSQVNQLGVAVSQLESGGDTSALQDQVDGIAQQVGTAIDLIDNNVDAIALVNDRFAQYRTSDVIEQNLESLEQQTTVNMQAYVNSKKVGFLAAQAVIPAPTLNQVVDSLALTSTNDSDRYTVQPGSITIQPGVYKVEILLETIETERRVSSCDIEILRDGTVVDVIRTDRFDQLRNQVQRTQASASHFLDVQDNAQVYTFRISRLENVNEVSLRIDVVTLDLVGSSDMPDGSIIDLMPYRLINDSYNKQEVDSKVTNDRLQTVDGDTLILNNTGIEMTISGSVLFDVTTSQMSVGGMPFAFFDTVEENVALNANRYFLGNAQPAYADRPNNELIPKSELEQYVTDRFDQLQTYVDNQDKTRIYSGTTSVQALLQQLSMIVDGIQIARANTGGFTFKNLPVIEPLTSPTADNQLATKSYVDFRASLTGGLVEDLTDIVNSNTTRITALENADAGNPPDGGDNPDGGGNPPDDGGDPVVPMATQEYVDNAINSLTGHVHRFKQTIDSIVPESLYIIQHNLDLEFEDLQIICVAEVITAQSNIPAAVGDKFELMYQNYNGSTGNLGYGLTIVNENAVDKTNRFKIVTNQYALIAANIVGSDSSYSSLNWTNCKLHITVQRIAQVVNTFPSYPTKIQYDSTNNNSAIVQTNNNNTITLTNAATVDIIGTSVNALLHIEEGKEEMRFNGTIVCDALVEGPVPSSKDYKIYEYLQDVKHDEAYPALRLCEYTYHDDFKKAIGRVPNQQKHLGWMYEDVFKSFPSVCKTEKFVNTQTGVHFDLKSVDQHQVLLRLVNRQQQQIADLEEKVELLLDVCSSQKRRRNK